jgi:hypothetical protein
MSSILPAVDALLGICNTSVELREAVTTFEEKMGGIFFWEINGKIWQCVKTLYPW